MAEIWAKFTKNERLVSFGAAIVLIGWLLGAISSYGFGIGFLSALGAIAVLAIYYLKYAPNSNIQWPAPVPVIVLVISAIIAIVAVLNLVQILGIPQLRRDSSGLYFIALLAITAGAVLMFVRRVAGVPGDRRRARRGRPARRPDCRTRPPRPAASAPPAAPAAPAAPPPAAPAPPAGDDTAPPA